MNLIITGGAGYLGGHCVEYAISQEHRVCVIDNLQSGYNSVIDLTGDITFIKADLKEHNPRELLGEYHIDQNTRIIHLAATVGEPAMDKDVPTGVANNTIPTYMMLELNLPLVFASTCSIYGKQEGLASENAAPNPVGMYAKSKLASENIVKENQGSIVRLATLCGKGRTPRSTRRDILPNQIATAAALNQPFTVRDRNASRPFVHVQDAARILVEIACREPFIAGGWNLVQQNMTKQEIALIGNELNEKWEPIFEDEDDEDPRDYRVIGERIARDMGITPSIEIKTGMRELYLETELAKMWDPDEETA